MPTIDQFPMHDTFHVSPFPPNGGWYDYETASKYMFARRRGRCPNEGNACFCTGACRTETLADGWLKRQLDLAKRNWDALPYWVRNEGKPRIRVKAGREVTP